MTQGPPAHEQPWSVKLRLDEVPETGRHVVLKADAATRAALAAPMGVDAVEQATASFDVTRRGRDGLHVAGRVTASVRQTCVVSLEPVANAVDEEVDVDFAPAREPRKAKELDLEPAAPDVESMAGDAIDLGQLATEFLTLGVDPYPRKPDAAFDGPTTGEAQENHPFAGLAALKKEPPKG